MTNKSDLSTEAVGRKLMNNPLPQVLTDMEMHIEAAENAAKRAEESAKLAKEIEDRLSSMEEKLVKSVIKRLARSEWILVLIVINLAIVFAAVLFAVAISGSI